MTSDLLVDEFDWSSSAIGSRDRWSQSLRTAASICLKSRFPMILFWGSQFVQIYNEAYIPLIGKRHPTALGQRAHDCWPDIWDSIGPMLHGVLTTGEATWSEDLLLPLERDGVPEERYFTFSYSPVEGAEGVEGVFCAVTETTERILQERKMRDRAAALVEAEARFHLLADFVPHIVYMQRPDGSVEWVNKRWYEYSQLPYDVATVPEGWKQVTHPDDFENLLATLERAFTLGEPYRTEVRFKPRDSADSAFRWHLSSGVPIRESDGTIRRWAGTATDIHDQKVLAEVLLKSEKEYRTLADAMPQIVFGVSINGNILYLNSRFAEYTGMPVAAALQNGWSAVVPEHERAMVTQAISEAATNGSLLSFDHHLYHARTDSLRWVRVRGLPELDAHGNVTRLIGTLTDVHDEKNTLEQAQRASVAFQEAALPQVLPNLPGLEFTGFYRAASAEARVGGDWYDAFRLYDGRIVISVGDVVGNGLTAAVTMAAVRQAIRGAAQIYPDPIAVLDAADRALRSDRSDAIVTAFLGVLDPLTLSLTYASAGHPPPFVRLAEGAIVELHGSGLPLGLREAQSSEAALHITLEPSSLLTLYTDGLTEATHDIAQGEQRLKDALQNEAVLTAVDPALAIAEATLDATQDDVAILAIRVGDVRLFFAPADQIDGMEATRWTFACDDAETGRNTRYAMANVLRRFGALEADVLTAELLYSELIGNVLRHAGGNVEVALDMTVASPVLHVLDHGPGFSFTARLPNDMLSESGRGLFIASKLATDLNVVPRFGQGSHARAVLPFVLFLAADASSRESIQNNRIIAYAGG